jgi:hypothetical protein
MEFEQAFRGGVLLAFLINVLAGEVYLLRVPAPAALLRPRAKVGRG